LTGIPTADIPRSFEIKPGGNQVAGEGEFKVRLIKMFGLATVAAVAAMAFVGATSASAGSTAICTAHTGLLCAAQNVATSGHYVLRAGTVGQLLAAIDVLCLGVLVDATMLGLASPQMVHSLSLSFTGCGTGSGHNNCTVTTPAGQQPLFHLLKTGLDQGLLTALSGQKRLVCSNIGLDCLYDAAGMEFEAAGGNIIANETPVEELGGKFFCPDEGLLDGELEGLTRAYILS
jgi:hypothetical protein